jgi:hypothetical protein
MGWGAMMLATERAGFPATSICASFATVCRTIRSITAVPDINTHVLFAAVSAYNPETPQVFKPEHLLTSFAFEVLAGDAGLFFCRPEWQEGEVCGWRYSQDS